MPNSDIKNKNWVVSGAFNLINFLLLITYSIARRPTFKHICKSKLKKLESIKNHSEIDVLTASEDPKASLAYSAISAIAKFASFITLPIVMKPWIIPL